jgi:hypothetical protein
LDLLLLVPGRSASFSNLAILSSVFLTYYWWMSSEAASFCVRSSIYLLCYPMSSTKLFNFSLSSLIWAGEYTLSFLSSDCLLGKSETVF